MKTSLDSEHSLGGLRVRSTWAVLFLLISAALSLITIILDGYQIELLSRIGSGGIFTDQEIGANDGRMQIVAILSLIVFIPVIVFFCLRIARAQRNLWDHNIVGLQFTPGWAVGWWFVPIAWLWKPYQVLRELWKGSSASTGAGPLGDWSTVKVTRILGWYWACWIIGNQVGAVAGRSLFRDETADELIAASWLDLISSMFSLAAALMAVLLIRKITDHQYKNLHQPTPSPVMQGTPLGGQSSAPMVGQNVGHDPSQ